MPNRRLSKHLVALESLLQAHNVNMGKSEQREALKRALHRVERACVRGRKREQQEALDRLCKMLVQYLEL